MFSLDKLKHLCLTCIVYMIFGLPIAIAVSITIELVQAEAGVMLNKLEHIKPAILKFKNNLLTMDTLYDICADAIGIGIGMIIVGIG